jgi:hypothetical protein
MMVSPSGKEGTSLSLIFGLLGFFLGLGSLVAGLIGSSGPSSGNLVVGLVLTPSARGALYDTYGSEVEPHIATVTAIIAQIPGACEHMLFKRRKR